MQIGFVGLGKMGGNMVRRVLERGGHEVVAFDAVGAAVEEARRAGARGVGSLEELVGALAAPRAIWAMVPSGDPTEATLRALGALCGRGDVVVDGGNSRHVDTVRRGAELRTRGIELVDSGTSGGVWGREKGYCMMIGGDPAAVGRLRPVLDVLAPEDGWLHVGPTGAGHYSKMVHNGVEYALMQAYAEGFALLESSPYGYDLKKLADLWNHGSVIRSWLLELGAKAFEEDPKLATAAPWVEDTGEGRWTVEAAIAQAVPVPAIAQALFARFRSRQENSFADRFIALLRKQFGGHAVRKAQ
jgi:6-phosphogluconate dehydrogenase